ncbi:hypothetical protein N7456_005762 [Penicillium angulare]|uniref:Xylanolytic transcriptional activator regulatory domain-containing protein n=1 Tax=Penicillium angulare TaxID=116970 RepID=A0A9W9G0Q5_9EURO|nr:hypothetical protein N7456_005762 [Penicillium angulare]
MALAARFSEKDEIQRQTRPLFSAARTLLKSVIDCISLDNIHASILVGNLCGGEGETDAEALYYGIASRMAQIHEFPSFRDSDDSMTREMTIRTWWSLYMIDRWSSAGLNLPRQLQDKSDILPMHEARFWRLKKGEIVDARSTSQPSLWGHMIRLAQVFGPIQDFHEALANGAMEEYDIEPVTHELVQRFENFDQQLPPDQRFSPRTLKEHISAGLGSIFVALHLGYHHYSTLLYFPYLDNQLSQIPGRSTYVARCKSHAASFSDLLRTSYNTPHCEAVYLIVTHMTVVSSSVLLHTLLFGDDDELSDARERLYSNFEVLLKLKQYWPGADSMV